MEKLKPAFIDQLRSNFEQSFFWACVAVFESQFPSSWFSARVHKPLCDMISDYGNNSRCAVILPRDWLKSQTCSIYYPVWRAMQDPDFTSMITLNTFTNASKKLSAIRSVLKSNPLLAQMYPERMPDSSCKMSSEAIELPRTSALANSTFEAAGVATDVTSRHVKLIVEDDTIAPEYDQMTGDVYEPSAEQVEKAIGFHKSAEFLLHDLANDQRLVVGTRWRQKDLFTHLKGSPIPWKFYELAVKMTDGKPDPNGSLMYPERFNDVVLKQIYDTVGDYMYQALMMSSPLSAKDQLFDESSILTYDTPPPNLLVYTTVDPASIHEAGKKRTSDPDYNVVLTAGMDLIDGKIYVLDYFRQRANPGEVIDAIFNQVIQYSPVVVGIEGVNYQKTLLYWLRETQNKRKMWFNVDELKTGGRSKPARVHGLQPIFANRRIHLKPWMTELRQEIVAYPRGAHDDIIDALAYQLDFWQNTEIAKDNSASERAGRFTGAYVLEELQGRTKRPEKFPHDLSGLSRSGHSIAVEEFLNGDLAGNFEPGHRSYMFPSRYTDRGQPLPFSYN